MIYYIIRLVWLLVRLGHLSYEYPLGQCLGQCFAVCLIIFEYRSHPDYRLILIANRDEFYNRPTSPVAFWDDVPDLLAGRDLKACGTWLGITRTGRIAAITNYREPGMIKEDAPSRGDLVRDYLMDSAGPMDYLHSIQAKGMVYNGFNLIIGDPIDLYYYSNRQGAIRKIEPGIHGLSNHLLDTPWPKVIQGKSELRSIIKADAEPNQEALFHLLGDRSIPPDKDLPQTGVGLKWERILSPLFTTSDTYGTRSSTVILWDYQGHVLFLERVFGENGRAKGETRRHTLSYLKLSTDYKYKFGDC